MDTTTKGKKLIGKGAFSSVYSNGNGTVTIKSICYQKEALALYISGDRFPKIDRIEYDTVSTYVMPEYDKTKGIKNKVSAYDWELYKCLQSIMSDTCYTSNIHNGYSNLYAAFEAMPKKFAADKEQLIDALDDLSNFGTDIAFEISPRNVFIEDGRLIFADCFFFRSQLIERRKACC